MTRAALGIAAFTCLLVLAPAAWAQPVLIESPTTVGPLDTEIMASDGSIVPLATAEITVRGTTLTINGRHDVASLVVEGGATVTHDPAFEFDYSGIGSDVVHGMIVRTSGSIRVQPDGRITASGRGFTGGQGPGTGSDSECGITGSRSASGGGFGGDGGDACVAGGFANGNALRPNEFGSGGGTGRGGAGGGSIRLVAVDVIEIDGQISSNGGNGTGTGVLGGGGGAGGSLWIEATVIAGSGEIMAIGGLGHTGTFTASGTGGGGRIRIDGTLGGFAGTTVARAGDAGRAGGAGTIAFVDQGQMALVVDNLGIAGGRTDFSQPLTVDQMLVTGGAIVSAQPLTALDLTVRGDLIVDADGRIDVSGRGHPAQQGPGAGGDSACGLPGARAASGGAHGGFGGSSCVLGGSEYGNEARPVTFGSGGGSGSGGRGGGAIELVVDGALDVRGAILANGTNGSGGCCSGGGGGAGGSLLISASSVIGPGSIRADGGEGHDGRFTSCGGGSGGRIAIYTCDLRVPMDNITVAPRRRAEIGTIFFGNATVSSTGSSEIVSIGSTARLVGVLVGAEATDQGWSRNGRALADGPTPWGSVISGSDGEVLTIENAQPEDAGLYTVAGDASCGRFDAVVGPLDVYCEVSRLSAAAGTDDGFALPREVSSPSIALRDALLNRRPDRPFHEFDQIPAVTSGVEADSRLAHTFTGLPMDIVAAKLTLRVRAGGTGGASPVAEGTDAIRLGFATGTGPDAQLNTAWDRRIGGTTLDPDLGLLAGELWESGDEALLSLDLAALPISAPLGEIGAETISLLDDLIANGFLDVTVVDETGVDFMLLEIETSDGTVFPWVVGPQDASACEGERAEFTATTGGVGGPFAYQWRRDGVAIDPAVNPTAAEATLVIEPVTLDDYASYDCIVSGDNTCGEATTTPAVLNDFGCCTADFDADGVLTVFDFLAYLNAFDAMDPAADLDGDGAFTVFDFLAFQNAFDAGCP